MDGRPDVGRRRDRYTGKGSGRIVITGKSLAADGRMVSRNHLVAGVGSGQGDAVILDDLPGRAIEEGDVVVSGGSRTGHIPGSPSAGAKEAEAQIFEVGGGGVEDQGRLLVQLDGPERDVSGKHGRDIGVGQESLGCDG